MLMGMAVAGALVRLPPGQERAVDQPRHPLLIEGPLARLLTVGRVRVAGHWVQEPVGLAETLLLELH